MANGRHSNSSEKWSSYTGKVVVQSATRLEVRIDGKRIGGKLSAFKLNHRQDGYLYQFTPISSV